MCRINIKKDDLEKLINDGLKLSDISNKLDISISSVRRLCKTFELKSKFYENKSQFIKCIECGEEFSGYIKEDRKFCNRSCSTTYNNKNRILSESTKEKISNRLKKEKELIKCLLCDIEFIKRRKYNVYCSKKCCAKHISNKPENKIKLSKFFSELTTKRHKEGDISIGWKSRKNLEPSYPEKITIDFLDKESIEYEREHKVGKYFIDFAFFDKKIALEIDGRTHDDIEVKDKDIRKDEFLTSSGWTVLRIKWLNDRKHNDRLSEFIDRYL